MRDAIKVGISMGCVLAMLACATRPSVPLYCPAEERTPIEALLVGGGPRPEDNQASIESNMRYVAALLPPEASRKMLFADGSLEHATVRYLSQFEEAPGSAVLDLLLAGPDEELGPTAYRPPKLAGLLDGAARKRDLSQAFADVRAQTTTRPLFLYFTGHGSPDHGSGENNRFDLWGGDSLSVRELAGEIAKLPGEQPVTLVMVQCFSGSFGNLVFEGGDPSAPPVERQLVGFFATVKDRVAAGCTPEINEAEYHDFTSYFFAALSGRDRAGKSVEGADYDGDGRVGMNEAFLFALVNDPSIDVPMTTSDVFLRRYVAVRSDWDVFRPARFSEVEAWADIGQRKALERLSAELGLSGEDRLAVAYHRMVTKDGFAPIESTAEWRSAHDRFGRLHGVGRQWLGQRYPNLAGPERTHAAQAIQGTGFSQQLLQADEQLEHLREIQERRDVANAHLLRLLRLAKSVILAHRLQSETNAAVKDRYQRLVGMERGVPFDSIAPHSLASQARCQP
jgi:hypothetical protein